MWVYMGVPHWPLNGGGTLLVCGLGLKLLHDWRPPKSQITGFSSHFSQILIFEAVDYPMAVV